MRLNIAKRIASFKAARGERKARRTALAAGIRDVFGQPARSRYELERQANLLAHQGGEISAWRRSALRSQLLDSLYANLHGAAHLRITRRQTAQEFDHFMRQRGAFCMDIFFFGLVAKRGY